ncbi:pseudouridine synthase [Cellulophaga baltica]|uniref:pseudouridine synthase n=1 Tax=Cellulophaga TaxID=104264 RepID=UPI001C069C24|nr:MULTISPECIES: pseudouridine synthase [Cellulophaga]MBU2996262.1 pseudouridine synthase [Cellulophaga baltica]MDO6767657.1 pseudouridine synthase [Cellulophaga sp. 1_MG-2023]
MKKHLHFKLYKPFGVLSQFSSNDKKEARSKSFLGELYDFPKGIMPIGRLDEKSEGLLLLTTDGKLSDIINQSGIEKEYYAQLDGEITAIAIEILKKGVEIGFSGKKYQTKPCLVKKIVAPNFSDPNKKLRIGTHRPNSWVSITITEGKFRQVRKMTAKVGFPTLRLVRVRIGENTIKNMQPNSVQELDKLL